MARVANPRKRAEWVERLRRFESSSTTVEAFCAAEGVSTASLYQWRAKLAVGEKLATSTLHPAAFVPVHVAAASEVAIHLPGGVQVTLPARERELIERIIAVLMGVTAAHVPLPEILAQLSAERSRGMTSSCCEGGSHVSRRVSGLGRSYSH